MSVCLSCCFSHVILSLHFLVISRLDCFIRLLTSAAPPPSPQVLEQRAISLTAELQIQRDAAERTAQSLSALRKEHTSAKAGLATAESAIRSLCTAVQQWQQKEEAGLQRLAESERRLEGFARRLRFAEGRLAVGRELGRGKREGRGQEAVYAGKGGRSGEPSEFVLRGVATMAGRSGEGHSGQGREGQTISGVHSKENRGTGERGREGEARTMAAAVEEPSRQETGRVEGFTRNGQDELAGTVAGNQAERREWPLFGRGQLERRAGEARGGVGGESEELEAEVERLQRERAMLVGRHLEGEAGGTCS